MTTSHIGWFHRSDQGVLRWVPASSDTGRSAESAGSEDLGPEPVTEQAMSPVQGPSTPGCYPVFAVMKGDMTYRVFGTGDLGSGMVHFQQQDLGWDGRYIRTWTIINTPQGIVAQPNHS